MTSLLCSQPEALTAAQPDPGRRCSDFLAESLADQPNRLRGPQCEARSSRSEQHGSGKPCLQLLQGQTAQDGLSGQVVLQDVQEAWAGAGLGCHVGSAEIS